MWSETENQDRYSLVGMKFDKPLEIFSRIESSTAAKPSTALIKMGACSGLRPAVAQDAALIVQFIRELAEYEREPQAAIATVEDICGTDSEKMQNSAR